jgi:hypothetical protein
MSITLHIQPDPRMGAYSAVPLLVESTNAVSFDKFNYLVAILYNEFTVTDIVTHAYENNTYAKVTTSLPNNYNVGDIVFINDDGNSDAYTEYYTIVDIISPTQYVINLTINALFGGTDAQSYNVIKYKISKNLADQAKVDFSNTLKDFVTQNLMDVNEIFPGDNTVFKYKYMIGEEYDYEFVFEDNFFDGGAVGFYNSAITSLADIPFQVGDQVVVQQDLFEWAYDDNQFDGGNVAYTSTNAHNFLVGQQITVTGQVTNEYYNGPTTILEVADAYNLKTATGFGTSTGLEPGIITGVPVPQYNVICYITAIVLDVTYGVMITTDNGYEVATLPISGIMKFTNKLVRDTNTIVSDDQYVYTGGLDKQAYTMTEFDKYVVQDRVTNLNNISTILNQSNSYRIEQSTKSWLLAHTSTEGFWTPIFKYYDNTNTLISEVRIDYDHTYDTQVDIGSYVDNFGDLRIECSTAHGLIVGDIIEIFQAPAGYNGLATVLTVHSTTGVTVDVVYTTSAPLGADYIKKVTTNSLNDYYFPVGIDQIIGNTNSTLVSGTALGTIVDDITHYTVELEKDEVVNTNSIGFFVNTDCSKFEIYHIMWKDRYGSWLSYPFIYASNDTIEVERKNYYKNDGVWDADANTFGYDSYGRGEQTYFTRSRDKFMLNSGWVKDFENELIKDMMASASMYVQLPTGDIVGGIIENKKVKFGKEINDQIFNYKFEIRVSRNDNRL